MLTLNISLLIVLAFLAATLAVAWCFTKYSTNFREYAVGNKQFSTAYLVSTVMATILGGEGMTRDIASLYHWGFSWLSFLCLINSLPLFFISYLALRMRLFMYNLSMSDTIGRAYGAYPRVIAALAYIALSVCLIIMQIHTISMALKICLGPVYPIGITLLTATLLIGYTSIGGIRSVTVTDIIQILAFFISLPLLIWYLYIKSSKSLLEIYMVLQSQVNFQLDTGPSLLSRIFYIIPAMLLNINPAIIQRIYMSTNHFQARRVFLYSAIIVGIVQLYYALISLLTYISIPEILEGNVLRSILSGMSPFFNGMVAVILLALSMSTADSHLNTCSIIFSHDIIENIMLKRSIIIPYRFQLRLAKITALIVGIVSILLSYCYNDLIELLKLACYCFIPIATGPFLLAIFGFRGTSCTALVGMAAGFVSTLVWRKWIEPEIGLHGAFPCMVVNCLTMLITHFVGIKYTKRKLKNALLW